MSIIESVRTLAARMPIIKTCKPMPVSVRQNGFQLARPQDYDECDMRLVLAALERAERIEALLKRGTQAGISNYPNQFVHFSYADGQEIAALSEPK